MNIKPITVDYNINRLVGVDLIAMNHVDDFNTRFLELRIYQGDKKIDLDGCSAVAKYALADNKRCFLLNENVGCTTTDEGNLLVPVDSKIIPKHKGLLLIEVEITDADNNVLTLPFPLRIKLKESIISGSELIPESEGTVTEILRDLLDNATREEDVNRLIDDFAETIECKPDGRIVYINSNAVELTIGSVITETRVQEIVDAADGAKGEKGDKGDKGDRGDDGSDYVLTSADKTEIANLAVAALNGNGVAY